MDLIKTIEEDEEISHLSEDSDAEVEVIFFFQIWTLFSMNRIDLKLCDFYDFFWNSINQQNFGRRKSYSAIISSLCHQCRSTITIHGMI